ncbi:hypothetical protein [Parasphingorhabdus sp.]|uniref:hypothetical protein n=1 Tax=Parasphingorhabdus sp. TaxID=2709688 RepID=UPI003000FD8D
MRILIAFITMLSLTACSSVGMIASPQREFNTTETLQLASRPANFVDTVVEVGKSLNYEYAGGDRSKNIINFTDNTGLGMGVLIGKVSQNRLTVSLAPDGRSVKFDLNSFGNFSTANEEKISERIGEFKNALQTNLR